MAAFRILAANLTDDDRLAAGASRDGLLAALADSEPLVRAGDDAGRLRAPTPAPARSARERSVAVRSGKSDSDKATRADRVPGRRGPRGPRVGRAAASRSGSRSCSDTTARTGRT